MDLDKKEQEYIKQLEQVQADIKRLQEAEQRVTGAILAIRELKEEQPKFEVEVADEKPRKGKLRT